MASAHISDLNQPKHQLAIEALSSEFDVAVDDMAAMYEEQLAIMESGARVREYIPILLRRKIQDILSRRQTATSAPKSN
jgi:Protein of unknown function (DUF3562)